MEQAGLIVRDTLNLIGENLKPGISTKKINDIAYDYIIRCGATPSFLNYNGFPFSVCVSLNNEVVHGMPSAARIVKEGDLVSIDVGACLKGFHADAARTFCIGNVSKEDKQLVEVTQQCFFEAFTILKNGVRVGDIGHAIGSYAEKFGYGVVRELVGHGIGAKLHEEPNVPNFGTAGLGARLYSGMTIAIEPMINAGTREVIFCSDGWTVITRDGSKSAHYENTVVIDGDQAKILTL